MNRRQFLINLSVVLGCSVVSVESMADAITSQINNNASKGHFTETQLECIKLIADIIIPQTDTPSASQAETHLYVDYYVHHFMTTKERKVFVAQMDHLISDRLLQLSSSRQVELVQKIDREMYQGTEQSTFYSKLKQLIVIGYYTSKVGATQALNFDPIPGPYQEIKLDQVGGVWF
ncbi:gluconate 2-dehydrogenase subunit 3 family protein [Shewanella olleyana]|uniref:gluconate 2-dehydrogenase subunit 3 family protein n=1 Tax=Shewanella olleyana TaxID=135626 RepID=UPI00200F66AD|nr:gluconate 2-dehydrogenase subunit 3 family protein [Shewanella olleyana]MCL1065658.1 gluconate 2-dehydrogenase subunit 3 family protein [Shewanella olleyana]